MVSPTYAALLLACMPFLLAGSVFIGCWLADWVADRDEANNTEEAP